MKNKRNQKPVRKCHDCELNLGDRCGVYSVPKEMWHHRRCPGYQNQEMFRQYQAEQAKHPVDEAKEVRREVAKRRASEPHWQGTLPHANR